MSDDEVPQKVKRDVAAIKNKHAEMKDKVVKTMNGIDETISKIQEFNDIVDKVDEWTKVFSDLPELVQPLSDKPDVLKKKLKEVEVFTFEFIRFSRFHGLFLNHIFTSCL